MGVIVSPDEEELEAALAAAHNRAASFLSSLDTRAPAKPFNAPPPLNLAENGIGAVAAIERLWERYGEAFSGSSGPRYWGYIQGGATPAAIAADWLCSVVDQNAQMHGDSPAAAIEAETIAMLRDLFGLPNAYHGIFLTGGSVANYVGLAVCIQSLGQKLNVDVSREGLRALPQVHILTGEFHASTGRAAGMLGLGRNAVERLPLDPGRERVSVDAVAKRLRELDGTPIVVVGNAGTVTTGDFDDLDALGDLAQRHGAVFHVDGAFGLFARLSPGHSYLTSGVERADTIASDAHKWLNVPHDSGFVFSRHLKAQNDMFKSESLYLPPPIPNPLNFPGLGPENSRRLRALPAWAALQAYGREGYREVVERCCALAAELGARIDLEPGFRLAAPVRLNIVCFQLVDNEKPLGVDATQAFVAALIKDGRVRVSASMLNEEPCIRLALVNWRTGESDLDIAMDAFRACRGL